MIMLQYFRLVENCEGKKKLPLGVEFVGIYLIIVVKKKKKIPLGIECAWKRSKVIIKTTPAIAPGNFSDQIINISK